MKQWVVVLGLSVGWATACGGRSERFIGEGEGGSDGVAGSTGGSGTGGSVSVGGSSSGGGPGVGGVGAGPGVGGVGAGPGVGGVGAGPGVGGGPLVGGSAAGATGGSVGKGGTNGKGGAGGSAGSPPNECLECMSVNCPDAVTCIANPACVQGTVCGIASCGGLEGSGALTCWIECYQGDAALALSAFSALLCIGESCGGICESLPL
jgi:hypothetical protein